MKLHFAVFLGLAGLAAAALLDHPQRHEQPVVHLRKHRRHDEGEGESEMAEQVEAEDGGHPGDIKAKDIAKDVAQAGGKALGKTVVSGPGEEQRLANGQVVNGPAMTVLKSHETVNADFQGTRQVMAEGFESFGVPPAFANGLGACVAMITTEAPPEAIQPQEAATMIAEDIGEKVGARIHSAIAGSPPASGAPTAPNAPTAPTAPNAPTAPTASSAPTGPSAPTGSSAGAGRSAAEVQKTLFSKSAVGPMDSGQKAMHAHYQRLQAQAAQRKIQPLVAGDAEAILRSNDFTAEDAEKIGKYLTRLDPSSSGGAAYMSVFEMANAAAKGVPFRNMQKTLQDLKKDEALIASIKAAEDAAEQRTPTDAASKKIMKDRSQTGPIKNIWSSLVAVWR